MRGGENYHAGTVVYDLQNSLKEGIEAEENGYFAKNKRGIDRFSDFAQQENREVDGEEIEVEISYGKASGNLMSLPERSWNYGKRIGIVLRQSDDALILLQLV